MADDQQQTYRLTAGQIALNDGRTLREGDTFVPTARQLDYYGTKLAPAGGGPQPARSPADRATADTTPAELADDETDVSDAEAVATNEADPSAEPANRTAEESASVDADGETEATSTAESATADSIEENDHALDETEYPGGYDSAEAFVDRDLDETGADGRTLQEAIEAIENDEMLREVYDAEQSTGRDRTTIKDAVDSREAELSSEN